MKINAPLGFGRRYIAAAAAEYQQLHPEVDVVLTLSDQPLTEMGERFDVGIHIGELVLSNLIAYAIAPNARLVYASPALLRQFGTPEKLEQLTDFPCLALRENNEDGTLWQFNKGRTSVQIPRARPRKPGAWRAFPDRRFSPRLSALFWLSRLVGRITNGASHRIET